MPYLSWQAVVVGDPLCAPFRLKPLPPEQTAPELESETELPKYFSARRLAVLMADGASSDVGKLMLKAEALQSRGDKVGATLALEAATDREPRLTSAHLMLAGLYEEAKDYDRAIERYRRVLAVAPKEPSRSTTSPTPSQYTRTLRRRRCRLPSRPTRPRAGTASTADTLGWIHYLLGNHEEAEKLLAEGATRAPGNAEIHLHLAHSLAALGRATPLALRSPRACSSTRRSPIATT